ncbi:signal recognition particle subunit [Coniosporium tulheliwenetii]|uniref:Signal recognition particle subunit n=1 Tax=Coniosporium tulheliwenetii TaxID=3383036 RepID=A0ACC2YSZ7_9PEZI|nr:signal recognition particle subunit [Cladosporium sp. JES 115]
MAHHARIEELSDSDSDPSDMDPSDFDPTQFANSLISPANIPSTTSSMPSGSQAQLQPQVRISQSQDEQREKTKHWQCLYPIYFDSSRSRAEGRRVGKAQAVPNPLAREIVDACQGLGLSIVFEPGKMHPKDWANPGRVRILLKEHGQVRARNVKNKHHLYNMVSEYLKAHPTTEDSPMRLRIAGMPPPKLPLPAPAVPRGWKMNRILPLHSPALSGGGVSEDMFKDMMAELQGGPAGAIAGGNEGKKKDKKKGKA